MTFFSAKKQIKLAALAANLICHIFYRQLVIPTAGRNLCRDEGCARNDARSLVCRGFSLRWQCQTFYI